MTDATATAKATLQRIADAAERQGKPAIQAACSSVLACIEQLESEQERNRAARRRAGYARAQALTPERRREIASWAGRCRQAGLSR